MLPHPELSSTDPRRHEAQWMALVSVSHARLVAYIGTFLHDKEQIRDTVQETYIKACRNSGDCLTRSDAYSWIMRIARNACLDKLKHSSRRMTFQSIDDDGNDVVLVDPRPTPLRSLAEDERNGLIAEAIREAEGSVNPQLLLTWKMRIVDGLSMDEVADILGVSPGTVGSRTSRCSALILGIYTRLNSELEDSSAEREGKAKGGRT